MPKWKRTVRSSTPSDTPAGLVVVPAGVNAAAAPPSKSSSGTLPVQSSALLRSRQLLPARITRTAASCNGSPNGSVPASAGTCTVTSREAVEGAHYARTSATAGGKSTRPAQGPSALSASRRREEEAQSTGDKPLGMAIASALAPAFSKINAVEQCPC